jgi:hypothetical protein
MESAVPLPLRAAARDLWFAGYPALCVSVLGQILSREADPWARRALAEILRLLDQTGAADARFARRRAGLRLRILEMMGPDAEGVRTAPSPPGAGAGVPAGAGREGPGSPRR